MSVMLRTWPFNCICCLMLLTTAVHMPGLHLFQLVTRLRDDATAKHQHDVHIMLAAGRGHFDQWRLAGAALINDQRLVSEHACGVCIVLDHIISHTNIDVHTRLAHVRLVFHQT